MRIHYVLTVPALGCAAVLFYGFYVISGSLLLALIDSVLTGTALFLSVGIEFEWRYRATANFSLFSLALFVGINLMNVALAWFDLSDVAIIIFNAIVVVTGFLVLRHIYKDE